MTRPVTRIAHDGLVFTEIPMVLIECKYLVDFLINLIDYEKLISKNLVRKSEQI